MSEKNEKKEAQPANQAKVNNTAAGQADVSSTVKPEMAAPVTGTGELAKKSHKSIGRIVLGVVVAIVAVLIILLVTVGVGIYKFGWQDQFSKKVASIFKMPAVIFDYKNIPFTDYQADLTTLDHFYTVQAEQNSGTVEKPTAEFLKKSVLSRMVREKYLSEAAKQFDITVSQKEIDDEFSAIVTQAGSESSVSDTLSELYNWTSAQFKEKVLKPYILRQKVQKQIAMDDSINATAKKKAEDVLALVQKGEITFEDLAKQYSEDSTATDGGDLGYFSKGDMVTEFENAVLSLKAGETSGIVKTQYGYHIIKLLEVVAATTDKAEQFHAEHILIKSKDLDEWLNEQMAKKSVWVMMSGFVWQKDCGLILEKAETCENNDLTNTADTASDETSDTNTNSAANSNANTNTANANQ